MPRSGKRTGRAKRVRRKRPKTNPRSNTTPNQKALAAERRKSGSGVG